MDAENLATTSKKDAVSSEGSKEVKANKQDPACLSSNSGGIQIKEKDELNLEKKVCEIPEEADELLEKIEEVVKGNITTLKGDEEEISLASEQDFLKKIDEEMKDSENSNALSDVYKAAKDSDSTIKKNEENVKEKSHVDGIKVNKVIFEIEDDNEATSSNVKKSKENQKLHADEVIVNKEIFVIEDDSDDAVSSNVKKSKENQKLHTDEVIVNKEIYVIEDDDDEDDNATSSNVKKSIENQKLHTEKVIESNKKVELGSSKHTESLSEVNRAKHSNLGNKDEVNKIAETLKTQKEGINQAIVNEGNSTLLSLVKEKINEKNAQIPTANQLNKVSDSAQNYFETSKINLNNQTPYNVDVKNDLNNVQQQIQQSVDLSKVEEPMCVDSTESSNDGKMEIDVDEKLEMDVDNENGSSNVIYNDEEMKPIENKAAENEIQNQQHTVASYKFQQGGNEVKNLSVQSQAKENLLEITVKVNVETGGTSGKISRIIDEKALQNNEIKETATKDNTVVNSALENVNIQKIPEALPTRREEKHQLVETIRSENQVTEKKSEVVPLKSSEAKTLGNDELDLAKEISKDVCNTKNAEKSNNSQKIDLGEQSKNVKSTAEILEGKKQESSTANRDEEIRKDITVQEKLSKEIKKHITESEHKSKRVQEQETRLQKDSEKHAVKTNTSARDLINVTGGIDEFPADDMKIENKLITRMKGEEAGSLTNSPIPPPTTNVFNSTPIAKQFEISSENVSKISDALEHSSSRHEHEQNLSENPVNISESATSMAVASKKQDSSSSTLSVETGSDSQTNETDNQSSSGVISKFINSIKNGIADSTTTDDGGATSNSKIEKSATGTNLVMDKTDDNMYEVNMWCEKNDVKFLSVKRLEKHIASVTLDKTIAVAATAATVHSDLSGQGSSNGSVSSLPQFSLPQAHRSEALTFSSSGSTTTTESEEKLMELASLNKTKHLIKGLSELCAFMINHFTKIRSNLPGSSHKEQNELTEGENIIGGGSGSRAKKRKLSTPKPRTAVSGRESNKRGSNKQQQQQRQSQSPIAISDSSSPVSKEGRTSKMSCESPLSVGGKNIALNETPSSSRKSESRSRKRSIGKVISDDDEEDGKPKSKQAKRVQQTQQQQGQGDGLGGQCVLAKWVDKKYYAGRILEAKPGNKFVVRFEDGASKVLQKDLIVFGSDDGTLPLKDHKIHALVDDDYECGIVTSIDKIDDKVLYTVKAETATVKVTASDIYLQDDQAKIIQNLQQNSQMINQSLLASIGGVSQDLLMNTFDASALSSGSMTRHTRHKRISGGSPITTIGGVVASPEPGTSAAGVTGKKGGKRQKRVTTTTTTTSASIAVRMSESSDITDTSTKSSQSSEEYDSEIIEGVQQEYQKTSQEIQDQRMIFIYEYRSINPNINVDEMLGVLPATKSLFKKKCFLLTCSAGLKPHLYSDSDSLDQPKRNMQFSRIPFLRNFLEKQIEEGGGKIYNYFKDIPKSKYRQCVLIAPRPSCTAKYIQCLAANIQAVSHEWIIDSCKQNVLLKKNQYYLPAGWSILLNKFTRWQKGKSDDQRLSTQPFTDTYILIASGHESFIILWSRICKLAGGTIRYVKSIDDITPSTKGYMVTDSDFPEEIKRKAEHFGIPIVSSVWIVQSLIIGRICPPDSHIKLSCTYSEDDDM